MNEPQRVNGHPRRSQLQLNTPAELAIRAAVDAVEEAGCHPLLTDAVVLLGQAREKVADYVELDADPAPANPPAAMWDALCAARPWLLWAKERGAVCGDVITEVENQIAANRSRCGPEWSKSSAPAADAGRAGEGQNG